MRQFVRNDNQITLATYQSKTQAYIDGTPLGDENLHKWLDEVLALVTKEAAIFEIGSGLGRDAEYVRSQGFSIVCSDATPNFIEVVRGKGFETHQLNILKGNIQGKYDLIFANAVLPHFAADEVEVVLRKVHSALKENGVFALSLKKGSGAVWSSEKLGLPRYIRYWQPEPFKNLVDRSGFEWLAVTECYTSYNNLHWMLITIRKK